MCRSATATNRVSYINEEKKGKVTPVLRKKNQKKFVEIWLCDFVYYGFVLNISSLTGFFVNPLFYFVDDFF